LLVPLALLATTLTAATTPARAAPPTTAKTSIAYVVSPHPDDELEGWALVAGRTEQYPVFVVLTHGEETGMCNVEPSDDPAVPALNLQTGERTPEPSPPQAPFSDGCQAARLDSWHHFLDGMGNVDTALDQGPPLVGTFTGDQRYPDDAPPLRCDTKGADNGACPSGDLPSPTYQVWAGPKSARVAFDLGDGDLNAGEVTWAIQTVRALRGTSLPDLPEAGVIGAGYRNLNASGTFVYDHKDHRAEHEALAGVDQGAGPQWARASSNDPAVDVRQTLDQATFCAALCVTAADGHHYVEDHPADAPTAWRWGFHQWAYGWLGTPDPYQLGGVTDAGAMLTQQQSFWTGPTATATQDVTPATRALAAPTGCQAGTPTQLQFAGTPDPGVCLEAGIDRTDLTTAGITAHLTVTNTGTTPVDIGHPSGCAVWYGVYDAGDGHFVGGGPGFCDEAAVPETLAPGASRTYTFTVDDDYGNDYEGATLPTGTFTLAAGLNVGDGDGHHAITDGLWYAPQTATVRVTG
jgi:hypothetical protein